MPRFQEGKELFREKENLEVKRKNAEILLKRAQELLKEHGHGDATYENDKKLQELQHKCKIADDEVLNAIIKKSPILWVC